MNIYYFHGLGSNGDSSTAHKLRASGHKVTSPTYSPEIFSKSALVHLESVVEIKPDLLIGTSMGGYYALWVASRLGLPALVVNPCFEPHLHLRKYLDEPAINYETGALLDITQSSLSDFEVLDISCIPRPLVVLGDNDEVIPRHIQDRFLTRVEWPVVMTNWGHRIESAKELAELISLHTFMLRVSADLAALFRLRESRLAGGKRDPIRSSAAYVHQTERTHRPVWRGAGVQILVTPDKSPSVRQSDIVAITPFAPEIFHLLKQMQRELQCLDYLNKTQFFGDIGVAIKNLEQKGNASYRQTVACIFDAAESVLQEWLTQNQPKMRRRMATRG